MELIYGTKNKAKLESMKRRLSSLPLTILGLEEVEWEEIEALEDGNSPLENARKKAFTYYEKLKRPVFSCDTGLYIEGLSEEQQPGVYVRRVEDKVLNDEEMILHYANMATRLGGECHAQYLNAICFILDENTIFEYMGEKISGEPFILSRTPHQTRIPGFPLDSLSIDIKTHKYYYDIEEEQMEDEFNGFVDFFREVLE